MRFRIANLPNRRKQFQPEPLVCRTCITRSGADIQDEVVFVRKQTPGSLTVRQQQFV